MIYSIRTFRDTFKKMKAMWAIFQCKQYNLRLDPLSSGALTNHIQFVFRINELILAEYDGFYYRAVCLSHSATGFASVYFIDYGNQSDNVSTSRIYKLPAELLYTCCATTCKLKGKEIQESIISDFQQVVKRLDNQMIKTKLIEKLKYSSGRYQYYLTLDL